MQSLLLTNFLDKPAWMWIIFLGVVFFLLIIDLGLLNRKQQEIGIRKSLKLSAGYIFISLLFGIWIWFKLDQESALLYYTGYVIEKSLSLDNLFVMAVIFSALNIPRKYQHRVLFWGILGVIVLRGFMIGVGAAIVHHFEWVLYVFAAFLIYTGVRLFIMKEEEENHEEAITNNPIIKYLQKHFPITKTLHGQKFFIRQINNKTGRRTLYITPLLLALIAIEFADVIFAVDSVPAIFAITTDTYIVFTSNIFAILGLRALFFALSAMMERFVYMKYALSMILIFVGVKVFIPLLGLGKVPALVSLSVTIGLLASGIIYSMYKTKKP